MRKKVFHSGLNRKEFTPNPEPLNDDYLSYTAFTVTQTEP